MINSKILKYSKTYIKTQLVQCTTTNKNLAPIEYDCVFKRFQTCLSISFRMF